MSQFSMDQLIEVAKLVGAIVTVLLGINVYFIKGLVKKIETVHHAVTSEVPLLNQRVSSVEAETKKVSDLAARVSVLEYATGISSIQGHDTKPRT